ncbi:GCN5-related N-acetyltransferase 3, chloroplastic [Lycium ferocissimum]|uniref:GCN5-related N-acetyltransferase 3, chloroplastic n=1 Tax=Lycium ferocissimum TaxID=112874 RepID=UPI0028163407|nr:GCN5-related N-acetyltransferase 3, chloroplastic [Lycium ferocissimum]
MAVVATVHGGYLPSKFRHKTLSEIKATPPIFISTNPKDINPNHLKNLYSLCNHSSHRFPKLNSEGRVEPVDINKLKKALLHSYVVVSVFTRPEFAPDLVQSRVGSGLTGIGGDWIGKVVPVTPGNGELVGFGRAVSDCGLTAAIYDVMVIPSLRRRGIGRKIVQRILRILANRDIYDIAALCSDQEKLFFRACGFGDDVLASTTMMYTRSTATPSEGEQMVTCAGRKLLLVPSVSGNLKI